MPDEMLITIYNPKLIEKGRIKMAERLKNKVAVVTGSSEGIGRACVELFAREGARVVVSDHGGNPALGKAVVDRINANGGIAHYCKADVRNIEEVHSLIHSTLEMYGHIDVLMNNAKDGRTASILDMQDDEWDVMYNTSLKAIAVACKDVIPSMIKSGGGSIINTSSIHGLRASGSNAPYNTFKAACISLSRQIAVDFGKYTIRCNALCPGRILTEGKIEWLKTVPREELRQQYVYPLGRPGKLEEIASAALFLASEESSFITGHALVVDGGLTAQLPDYAAAVLHDAILPEDK